MGSKLTLHLSGWDGTLPERLARAGAPPWIVLHGLDSEMYAEECLRWGLRPVYRHMIPGDRNYKDISPDELVAIMRDSGTLDKLRGKVVWTGINEGHLESIGDVKALNAWYWRFQEILIPDPVGAFSLSEGNPGKDLIPYLDPGPCPFMVIHQYHRCRRYHRTIWELMKPSARRNIIIKETGFDLGGDQELHGARGNISDDEYMDVLAQEDEEYIQDEYIECAAIYQFLGNGWRSFESSRILNRLLAYMAARRDR